MPYDPGNLYLAIDVSDERAMLATVSDRLGVIDKRRVDAALGNLLPELQILADRAAAPILGIGLASDTPLPPELVWPWPSRQQRRAVCQLLGEAHAALKTDLILWSIGEQLQGAALVDAQPWLRAVDFGHLTADPLGPPCPCGARGCANQYASEAALQEYALQLAVKTVQSSAGPDAAALGEDLRWRQAIGEPQAERVAAMAAQAIAAASRSVMALLGIEHIVLTARSPAIAALLLPAMQKLLPNQVFLAQLGEDASLVGAARLFGGLPPALPSNA